MKMPFKLLLWILCFLFMCPIARADIPSKEQFDFLTHYQNTPFVESPLELTKSTTELLLSTLMNTGVWYLICKSPEFVFGVTLRFGLENPEEEALKTIKAGFCLQLASIISAAEVTLVGHVSPWPLTQVWWQPLRFAGAGLVVYANDEALGKKFGFPLATLIFIASDAIARTVSGAVHAKVLRTQEFTEIAPEYYVYGEYTILSVISGMLVGGVVYEVFIDEEGIMSVEVISVSLVFAAMTGIISGIVSTSTTGQGQLVAGTIAGAGAGSAIVTKTRIGAEVGAGAIVGAIASAGSMSGAVLGAISATAAVIAAETLMLSSSKMASNNPFIKMDAILASALSLALINSLSNYAIYGYPLEESLSDTAWALWKKFYAPLDYLSTLFN